MPPHSSSQSKKHSEKASAGTSSNGSEKSKNVSHVPCKFFRQSICQAGDKCPFSHDLSADTSQMVCKYFQRGNCKFGSKCALLHVTPDGKAVNAKKSGSSSAKGSKKRDKSETSKAEPSGKAETVKSDLGKSPKGAKSPESNELSAGSKRKPNKSTSDIDKPSENNVGSEKALVDLATQILAKFNDHDKEESNNKLTVSKIAKPPSSGAHSLSSSLPIAPRSLSVSSISTHPGLAAWRPANLHTVSAGDDFAIADDEDEDYGDAYGTKFGISRRFSQSRSFAESAGFLNRRLSAENGRTFRDDFFSDGRDHGEEGDHEKEEEEEEEEEGYTEQLVPSALQDLLTPQERERRNSRNSQQKSGRVFSSPSLTSPINMGIRRSSSSSEPSGDLWGPRQIATPFGRNNNHLSSPPLASAQLVSSSSSALSSPIISNSVIRGGTVDAGAGPTSAGTPGGSVNTTPKPTHSFAFDSHLNPWGLSKVVISENEENLFDGIDNEQRHLYMFDGIQQEQKNLYHPFQRYQQNSFLSTEKT